MGAAIVPARAEGDPAALAAAVKSATATLQGGLKASEAQGTLISAKFEIEDGKLQQSIYTVKGNAGQKQGSDKMDRQIRNNRKLCIKNFPQCELVHFPNH